MSNVIEIHNEDDAFAYLDRVLKDQVGEAQIQLVGWPTLTVHLKGKKYHQTITPSAMKGFIELQNAVYRSYALARYDSPNTRLLTKEERDELEIQVKVDDGSSLFEIDLTKPLTEIVTRSIERMEPAQVATIVILASVLWAGNVAWRRFLDHRKDVRIEELRGQTNQKAVEAQIKTLEALQYTSAQETERMRILTEIMRSNPRADAIDRSAHDTSIAMIKAVATAEDGGEVAGVPIDQLGAMELVKNARRLAEDIYLNGEYRIERVDSSDPSCFKVRVRNVANNDVIDATLQDDFLTDARKRTLQAAEWGKKTVILEITAKALEDEIRNAVIVGVSEAPKA